MQIIDTQVAEVTLQSGEAGFRVVFCGEGGECVTVEMANTEGARADEDAMARAKAILVQTATFGLASNDSQSNGNFDEVSITAGSDGDDTVYLFEYRDGESTQRLPQAKLPSLEAARAEALRCAMELLLDLQPGKDDLTGWLVRVSDESGRVLCTIDVSEADAARQASESA